MKASTLPIFTSFLEKMHRYDSIIIGAGMGGLVTAALLAKEGQRICVLEKNRQLGGNLQVFARDKQIFDAGVHYLGSLARGNNLYQLLQYLGVYDQLKLERMNEDGFDKILISGDTKQYPIAQGHENFVHQLVNFFPEEKQALNAYIERIRQVCERFPLYGLQSGTGEEKMVVLKGTVRSLLNSLTANEKLQSVLAGNNLLYAGTPNTPFYVHALITDSYLQSAWKAIDGGSQLANSLARVIRENSGDILNHCEIVTLKEEDGLIQYALDSKGNRYFAQKFISNADPVSTLNFTDSSLLKPVYRNRIRSLSTTVSSFSVQLVLKQGTIPYENCNYYYHREGMLWQQHEYTESDWPRGYALFFTRSRQHPEYAGSITIFTAMRFEECMAWQDTSNTVAMPGKRGASYERFKEEKARKLLHTVYEKFPQLEESIEKVYSSTPLTYRDYVGTTDGTMYGFAKDANDPLKTQISPRTRIPNLFLTGQNINLHGVLGTALSGILTAVIAMDRPELIQKIRNA